MMLSVCVCVCVLMGGVRRESPAAASMCVQKSGEDEMGNTQSSRRMLNFRRRFAQSVFC